ncbi:MAG: leucine-rich repeat domain-containing protein [Verrucomicrobiota bacterium]|jgi:hypothetical protein
MKPIQLAPLCLVCLCNALTAGAQPYGDFTYTNNSGTITITRYLGTYAVVTIPSAIDSLPVTGIGGFFNSSPILVTIPSSVTSIGDSAFAYCNRLAIITIPNSVTNIGGGAFSDCGDLAMVTIGNGVTNIGAGVFSECPSLTIITIPDSVTSIGESAFSACTSLLSITIPGSVTSIGDGAFSGTGLTNIAIPSTLANIGKDAFAGCVSLTQITVDPLNPFYSSVDGVLFDKSQTTLIQYPSGKAGRYTTPDSVTSIGSEAFYGCEWLSSVTIPNSVTNIGSQAFSGCTRLASVAIPNSVTSIGSQTFSGCSSLASLTIPKSITGIGDAAFADCGSLRSAYFEGNAPIAAWSSFSGSFDVTVYYQPGTMGWRNTFADASARLWNPKAKTPTVLDNQFTFDITGTKSIPIVVEASTNLASGTWVALQTATLTNGLLHFTDPDWITYPTRFYRIRSP